MTLRHTFHEDFTDRDGELPGWVHHSSGGVSEWGASDGLLHGWGDSGAAHLYGPSAVEALDATVSVRVARWNTPDFGVGVRVNWETGDLYSGVVKYDGSTGMWWLSVWKRQGGHSTLLASTTIEEPALPETLGISVVGNVVAATFGLVEVKAVDANPILDGGVCVGRNHGTVRLDSFLVVGDLKVGCG